jgi:hypothetical protein
MELRAPESSPAGLIENADEWRWQGTMHDLLWRE